jgi:hypothetical protein
MGRVTVIRVAVRSLLEAIIGGPVLTVAVAGLYALLAGEVSRADDLVRSLAAGIVVAAPFTVPSGIVGAASALGIARVKHAPWRAWRWSAVGSAAGALIGLLVTSGVVVITGRSPWLLELQTNSQLLTTNIAAGVAVGALVAWRSTGDLERAFRVVEGGITTRCS